MSSQQVVERDERTEVVENASYVLGYKVMAYALLVDVMWRSFQFREAAWDLMALVILSGLVVTFVQWRQRILTSRWVKLVSLAFAIALVLGVIGALVLFRV